MIPANNDADREGLAPLADAVGACRICRDTPNGPRLAHDPRPIFRVSASARLLIASQAPGTRAHASGIPFSDASGDRLRAWLGIGPSDFYDAARIAIVPMGFCFPGHDAHKGDLPPRRECRAAWHDRIFQRMPQIETVLAIGIYAIRYHIERLNLGEKPTALTAIVADWRRMFDRPAPRLLPLPHPSWRNSGWLKRHPWFEDDLLPVLRQEVRRLV
jgi:uracil-DNA glycosylase